MPEQTNNKAQITAIEHASGPMQVLAGPGSGKTYLTIRRIRHLIRVHGISPEKILVITFTKAAANEMKERFDALMNLTGTQVRFGTFHSVFYHILKETSPGKISVIGDREKYKYLTHILKSYQIRSPDQESIEALVNQIGRRKAAKAEGFPDLAADQGIHEEISKRFEDIYRDYCQILKSEGKLDFDDMILDCYHILTNSQEVCRKWQSAFSYILIDEFQDISSLQYEVMKILAKPEDNLFVVGDDDQSIYGFRGAGPDIMQGFMKDYPEAKQLTLRVNYRCSQIITDWSGKMIAENTNRFAKEISASNEGGDPICFAQFDSKEKEQRHIVSLLKTASEKERNNTAIIFRTNAEAEIMAEFLLQNKIPLNREKQIRPLLTDAIAMDLYAYLRVADSIRADKRWKREDFLRIMNKPLRLISRDALSREEMCEEDLESYYKERPAMLNTVKELFGQLRLIGGMRPYPAINFIRKGMGYDEHIKESGSDESARRQRLAEEIQHTALHTGSIRQWLEQVETAGRQPLKQNPEKQKAGRGVHILTMHASKGLEFESVILPDLNEGIMPYHKAESLIQIEEERRLFYVAVTRAKKRLSIFCHVNKPSRFIKSYLMHLPHQR